MLDYYEFLQISPNADSDTIHRVYRFLATRLHPDNPQSGDAEMFHRLKTAYDVLSSPDRRAEYDATRRQETVHIVPWSTSIDFMDSLEGELNRRLAVLAVLYYRRRTSPSSPEVPLAEIELRMGFPRDYLDFTTWYLVKKGYVVRADNSEFTLTAEGVDFVETQRAHLPVLNKMLTSGSTVTAADKARPAQPPALETVPEPFVRTGGLDHSLSWRMVSRNGHSGALDPCAAESECSVLTLDRRAHSLDRRINSRGRRASD
jgi:curved DNA-binding protein